MDAQAKATQAVKQLNLDWDAVANIYLIGSRLWGTFTAQSDFDLLIVLKRASKKKPAKTANNKSKSSAPDEAATGSHRVVHAGQFDALLYDQELYIQRIKQYSFLEMITLWIPAENVWKQELDPRPHWQPLNQGQHVTQLWTSTVEMVERDLKIAQKHFEKGARDRAARVIRCTLRVAQFAADIAEHGHVTDYRAANAPLTEGDDWTAWRDSWRPLLQTHLHRLRARCETVLGRAL